MKSPFFDFLMVRLLPHTGHMPTNCCCLSAALISSPTAYEPAERETATEWSISCDS